MLKLWQVAALVGALSLLSAERAAASGDEEAGQDRKKAGTKRGLFGRTFGNERSPEEGAILDEDEGYWERFLQAADNSVPTPTPRPPSPPGVCGTEVRTCRSGMVGARMRGGDSGRGTGCGLLGWWS